MTSSFTYAREAIESVVKIRFEKKFSNYQWGDVTPSDMPPAGPGCPTNDWQTFATEIVKAFNKNLSPHPGIVVSSAQKSAAHGKRLIEFQIFLAAKADTKLSSAIVAAF